MKWDRRDLLTACAGAVPALLGGLTLPSPLRAGTEPDLAPKTAMGVVIHSYGARGFDNPLAFLEFCRSRGAGGVQTVLGVRDEAYTAQVRAYLDRHGLYLEGSVRAPHDRADVGRFEAEVRSAKACGATVLRTALLSGRRYETFEDAAAFRAFAAASRQSLALARPVVERHEVRLAVENHKDWRAGEVVELIERADSPHIGVCVDTGNSIALLETPQETAEALAPYAFTTHIKDMGVREYADGFLLAEVPLGTGFLDLARIITTLRRARPQVRLNLEMITRDPLRVPCLTPKYWVTLESVTGRRLAEMLALVRAKAAKEPLPGVSGLSREERLRREDDNVVRSLRYAREAL